MLLFVISIIIFVVALLGFMAALGLWTYADAKVRTDKPGVWTLIVVFVPNFIGLLIYLLVGRNKDVKSPGKYKKTLLAFIVCFFLATGFLIGSSVRLVVSDTAVAEWNEMFPGTRVSIGKVEHFWNKQWTVSFGKSNAELSRRVNMKAGDLAAFRVIGNAESGKLFLRITQNNIEKVVDITDYNGPVDMREFQPGRVRLTLFNEDARNAGATLSWRR